MLKELTYTFLSASGKVSIVKSRLVKVIVTPDGSNASYADVHDGESDQDPQVARLRVPATQSVLFDFGGNFILERGIDIVFGTNLSRVTVIWEPAE